MKRVIEGAGGAYGKAVRAEDCAALTDIPSLGPALAADLRMIGITHPAQLVHRDAFALYLQLSNMTGHAHAPWVLDCFLAACDFMRGTPARPWWHYTSIRERRYGGALRNVLGGATFIQSVTKARRKMPAKSGQVVDSINPPDALAYSTMSGSNPPTLEDATPARSIHAYSSKKRLNGEAQRADERYRVARLWLSEHLALRHPTSGNLQDPARSRT